MDPPTPTPIRTDETGEGSRSRAEEKRRKQRAGLARNYDPLAQFTIPEVVRKLSSELAEEANEFAQRLKQNSATSLEIVTMNEEQSRHYIDEREHLANDATVLIKKSRAFVNDMSDQGHLDPSTSKRVRDDLESQESQLVKERTAVATRRAKLEFGIMTHASHSRLGEAYLACLAEKLDLPSGARLEKGRESGDQSNFRKFLRLTYTPPGFDDPRLPKSWCHVTGQHLRDEEIKAAHIYPVAAGEVTAAYIFGLDVEDGYTALWSVRNGLLLYDEVEKAFDAARFVIIPDPDAEGEDEYKVVILDESLLDMPLGIANVDFGWRELNNRRLQFKTTARPGRRYLYVRCLLSLFSGKRFDVKGWEADFAKVGGGTIWGTPGKWVRGSIIKALAYEIGDVNNLEEITKEEIGSEFPDQVSPLKEKRMAVAIRQAVEEGSDGEDRDDDEEDDDEEESERV
ncbi:hypothetical protein H2199_005456 [Coniosporium tulheliwenetii]|uniref:Uncharacterized protein n=1 Tax=Coniosporium tulheliwenetii TaxID=3383036 RepID=A0ACC2Z1K9_9PEZI|nr:hypothetical protein H2199_005456 [Cladosporium sp. JES 115]